MSPPPSFAVLWFLNGCERKPWYKFFFAINGLHRNSLSKSQFCVTVDTDSFDSSIISDLLLTQNEKVWPTFHNFFYFGHSFLWKKHKSMWFWGIGTFWAQKYAQEKSIIFTKVLNYSKSSCILFFAEMSHNSHYKCCFQK